MARLTKKKYLAVGTVVAVLASAGVAFAYWTSTGSGTGSVTTGTSTAWDVEVDDIDLDDLTPGGPIQTVGFTVQNDNSGVQNLSSTVASVASTSNPGCTAADFDVSATTGITYGDVASGATETGSFTIQMINTASN